MSGMHALEMAKGMITSRDPMFVSYLANVLFEHFGDCLRMLGVLLRNDREVTDLISIVDLEVSQRVPKILRDFSRGGSGERTPGRSGRHEDSVFTRSQ